jgi:hypothetical protein
MKVGFNRQKSTTMKKAFLAAFALLLFGSSVYSQGFKLGAKAGANLTKVTGSSFKDEFQTGYHVGGFAEIDLGKRFGIQPEVLWTTSKTTRDTAFSQVYQFKNRDLKLDYLAIPVLLRINVSDLLTLNVGPQFGVLLNENKTALQNGNEAFKGNDFSMIGGATLNLKMLRIYGRYNVGLNNLNDIDKRDEWKSQQIQLGVGLRL